MTLVAVGKTHPAAALLEVHAAGLRDFGESYVQEALGKIAELRDGFTWHFIGTIQSNKTKPIAENFQWVQTVASVHVAQRLSRQRPWFAGDLQVCLQLAPGPAASRGGVPAGELAALAAEVAGLPRLKLRGLMFMPLPGLDRDMLRAAFCQAREQFERLRAEGHVIDTLSMGMSDDLAIAIAEGSTMVRVGTALFGPRPVAQAGQR